MLVSTARWHAATSAVPETETTSLFALLWRTRVIRHPHAASHVPSNTAGEHATSAMVLVRPRGRAPTSESDVREHTPHFRCSSRTTRTRTTIKNAKMITKAARVGGNRLHYEEPKVPVFKFADLSKLPARFGRFRSNYCHLSRVVRVVRVKLVSRSGH